MVRREHGAEVAKTIARRMVVPHRDGGQAQYIQRPLPRTACDTVGEVIVWTARHFLRTLGTTPNAFRGAFRGPQAVA